MSHEKNKYKSAPLHILGFILGFLIGAFGIFTILFLIKVLPHGGF